MIRIIKCLFVACILVGLASSAYAEVSAYELIKEKSYLKFIVIQNNAPVGGKFTDFGADIVFDFDRPQDGKIKAEVMTGSLKTSHAELQLNAVKPDWLSAEAFPAAIFETTKISKIPSTMNYYAEGNLTLRGKTAPAVLNFQLEDLGDTVIADGFATIKRSDFDVGQGEWAGDSVVRNQVRVEFRIVARKKSTK